MPTRARHLCPAAQRVIAETEAPTADRRWRRQRLQAVQRVVHKAGRTIFRIGESRAVRRCVVRIASREIPPRTA